MLKARSRFFVGICGGSGSGKSSVCNSLCDIQGDNVVHISQDLYYMTVKNADYGSVNFDHPDSVDMALLISHLKALERGESIRVPSYDFSTNSRTSEVTVITPNLNPIIIVEGILIFSQPELVEMFDLKVFVDTPADVRLLRRLERDVKERGRTVDQISTQYMRTVRPMHKQFVQPSRVLADIIIPFGNSEIAVEMISSLIEKRRNATVDTKQIKCSNVKSQEKTNEI